MEQYTVVDYLQFKQRPNQFDFIVSGKTLLILNSFFVLLLIWYSTRMVNISTVLLFSNLFYDNENLSHLRSSCCFHWMHFGLWTPCSGISRMRPRHGVLEWHQMYPQWIIVLRKMLHTIPMIIEIGQYCFI